MKTEEASKLIRRIAEPCPAGDSVKQALVRASERLGWSFNRVKDIWYRDERIHLSEAETKQLREFAREHEQYVENYELRNELRELHRRLARLEQIAAVSDEKPYRDDLAPVFL